MGQRFGRDGRRVPLRQSHDNPSLFEVVTGGGRTFHDQLIAGRRADERRRYWAAFYDGTLAALAVVVTVVTLATYY